VAFGVTGTEKATIARCEAHDCQNWRRLFKTRDEYRIWVFNSISPRASYFA
jgi:hypothetical protein